MLRVVLHGRLAREQIEDYRRELCHQRPLESGALPAVSLDLCADEAALPELLNQSPAHVVVSIGPHPAPLAALPLRLRRRWAHFDEPPAPKDLLRVIHETYLSYAVFPSTVERDEPLISVFTPTHDSGPFLLEAHASLRAQSHRNWEWVIVDDGSSDGTRRTLRELCAVDPRVRAYFPQRGGMANIGLIKRLCTGLCTGEILLELDHDDLLAPHCLERVAEAFAADPELGMVHSNFAEFLPDGGAHTYPEWVERGRYRRTELDGRLYTEALAYDVYGDLYGVGPVIRHMAVCPNHVRAFRASELCRLGGYNPHLVLADDYELMIRMFLHSKIGHIPELLYLYRIHDNTWSRFNDFAKWMFNVLEKRWRGEIMAKVARLKAGGLWNPEPQGRLPDGHPVLLRAAAIKRLRGYEQ